MPHTQLCREGRGLSPPCRNLATYRPHCIEIWSNLYITGQSTHSALVVYGEFWSVVHNNFVDKKITRVSKAKQTLQHKKVKSTVGDNLRWYNERRNASQFATKTFWGCFIFKRGCHFWRPTKMQYGKRRKNSRSGNWKMRDRIRAFSIHRRAFLPVVVCSFPIFSRSTE